MDRYSVTLILFFIHFSREDVILVDRYSVTFIKKRCNNLHQKATYLFSQDQTCARNRGKKIISSSFSPPFVSNRKLVDRGREARRSFVLSSSPAKFFLPRIFPLRNPQRSKRNERGDRIIRETRYKYIARY